MMSEIVKYMYETFKIQNLKLYLPTLVASSRVRLITLAVIFEPEIHEMGRKKPK